MSFNVPRMFRGVTNAGSNSTSACSCVRLTATLWTPGSRPTAFSIVPVHSEQCSPLILARNRERPPAARPSSTQYGVDAVGSIVATLLMTLPSYLVTGLLDAGLHCLRRRARRVEDDLDPRG